MCHDSHECVALAERELTESVAAKQSAAAERAKGPAASEKRRLNWLTGSVTSAAGICASASSGDARLLVHAPGARPGAGVEYT